MGATDRPTSPFAATQLGLGLVVTGVVSLVTLGTAFGLLALGVEAFWVAFPVGFGGVLPLALGVLTLWTADREGGTER